MEKKEVTITPPKFETVKITIVGDTKLVVHKFSKKAREQIRRKQEEGSRAKKGTKREPKNFDELYKEAAYISKEEWYGFPAAAIRNSMVSACKIVGFHMTKGKLGIFIEQDGFDEETGRPLIKVNGTPHPHEDYVRIDDGGCDINVRPMWDENWTADIRIRYDADMFSMKDIVNLLHRAGLQVGILEGRPDSKKSCGVGWGTFKIKNGGE